MQDAPEPKAVSFTFTGPSGPVGAVFVEVELDNGKSIRLGTWGRRPDGLWALRFTEADLQKAVEEGLR